MRLLLGQKPSGCHGASEDVLFLHLDAHACQLGDDVSARPLAVVGQETKGDVAGAKLLHKTVRLGNQFVAAIDHTIHVDQIAMLHAFPSAGTKTSSGSKAEAIPPFPTKTPSQTRLTKSKAPAQPKPMIPKIRKPPENA